MELKEIIETVDGLIRDVKLCGYHVWTDIKTCVEWYVSGNACKWVQKTKRILYCLENIPQSEDIEIENLIDEKYLKLKNILFDVLETEGSTAIKFAYNEKVQKNIPEIMELQNSNPSDYPIEYQSIGLGDSRYFQIYCGVTGLIILEVSTERSAKNIVESWKSQCEILNHSAS